MRDGLLVRLTSEVLDPGEALAFCGDPAAGAAVLFAGTVRDHSQAGEVTALDYEAWTERAEQRLEALGEELFDTWPVKRVALLHRTGHLEIGETSVVVCCSAPHRAEAFEAARHGIEQLKADVPIWKKEALATGDAHWVMGS
ncbi:MAG TPA: molybdenum cofactor biosynthesis protein MoaE [Actinobacteria bacterium]|jgi:molybdopterin synthase catalytic subunit|nr:molybdenum cofactor biosynthesis protein MoaE [Actinomycetota bacterium]HCP62068.1 molybdenum cofactor biosynthesis protein MoaE [Actinomycetota bacterium]